MNLDKYFHHLSPCSPPIIQSSDTSTNAVVTNSSLESETSLVTSSLLNDAMGEEFVIPVDRLLRDEYIRKGPIQMKLPNYSYPQTLFNWKMRAFQATWYISRLWLEYNKYNDSALCFPCRVFGLAFNKYDRTFMNGGFRQWPHALEKNRGFDKHSVSENHSMCMEKWFSYLNETPVDALISEEIKKALSLANDEMQSRKDLVYLLIDIVNTLAQLNLPFRGHFEGEVSTNKGVFKGIVELISRYHPPLMIHLQKGQANPKGYPSYLSPTSQNEMIKYSAEILREDIIENIKKAHFFAICLDTTPDIAKQDQLSFVVRYVNENGEIVESLLDFIDVANCTAVGLLTSIGKIFSKHGLLIESLRGQGYDGCATMAGRYNGVQNLIKIKNPKAYFVHCYAHRLNLVIVDTCKRNVITRNFFGIMQKLYTFIEGSTKRHGLFKDIKSKSTIKLLYWRLRCRCN